MKRNTVQEGLSKKSDVGRKSKRICPCQDAEKENAMNRNSNTHTRENNQPGLSDQNTIYVLTNREKQVATLASVGLSNKEIGDNLQISAWTVSTHLRHIFTKLNVDNRTAMAYKCQIGLQEKNV